MTEEQLAINQTGVIIDSDRGASIHVYPDGLFYPADPRPEECSMEGIAHSLAFQCRYKGNCDQYYSVAQHLVQCWSVAPLEFKREALLHDIVEAVSGLGDVPRPMKQMFPELVQHEHNVAMVIHPWAEIPVIMSPEVKEIDNRMLATEKKFNLVKSTNWGAMPDAYNWTEMECWSPEKSERTFLYTWEYENTKLAHAKEQAVA